MSHCCQWSPSHVITTKLAPQVNLVPKYVLPREDRLGSSTQWFYEGDMHFMAYKNIGSSFENNSKGANSNVSHTKDNKLYGETSLTTFKRSSKCSNKWFSTVKKCMLLC